MSNTHVVTAVPSNLRLAVRGNHMLVKAELAAVWDHGASQRRRQLIGNEPEALLQNRFRAKDGHKPMSELVALWKERVGAAVPAVNNNAAKAPRRA